VKTAIGAKDQARAASAPVTEPPARRYSAQAAIPEPARLISVPVRAGGTPINEKPAMTRGNPGKKAVWVRSVYPWVATSM